MASTHRYVPSEQSAACRASLRSASGTRLMDVDGNEYLDFVCSWGPLILGHAHPSRDRPDQRGRAQRHFLWSAPCRPEIELAERIVELYPHVEQARCVSSGTEAVMSAVRLARGYTGRDLIVKFSGCYHGHVDHLLVAAGSGLVTLGQPCFERCAGGIRRPDAYISHSTTKLPQLSCSSAKAAHIAAVIIEPIPANNGLLLAARRVPRAPALSVRRGRRTADFRRGHFRISHRHPAGPREHYGIRPDIATFGKVIGGGMPVGAFASTREIMSRLSPAGDVYQAGHFVRQSGRDERGPGQPGRTDASSDGWAKLEVVG